MLLAAVTVNKNTEQQLVTCEVAMPLCAHLQICMHISGKVNLAGCGIAVTSCAHVTYMHVCHAIFGSCSGGT